MKTCPKCKTLRARFVKWLGVTLGVMTDAPPQKKEQRMEIGLDQLMAIIGNKEVENISLRMKVAQLEALLKEFEPKPEAPKLAVVEGKP